jgi:nucleoside-diphosphate-sugar epimerase
MGRMLITGAGGFVGQALCAALADNHLPFTAVVRRTPAVCPMPDTLIVPDINETTDWRAALDGVDVVVHLAARVHVLQDAACDPLAAYRLGNCAATLNLARQCTQAGVRRFIYLSSVKVNGEATAGRPFGVDDAPQPQDPYGISKWEAEQGLARIAQQTGLELVIIRPPLVYGPRVKANFLQLMRWVERGIPLPLAGIDNRRSMVYVGNLVDLVLRCAASDSAAGHTFFVSDGLDVSTSKLICTIANTMHRRANIFWVPQWVLIGGGRLFGRAAVSDRLLGSLQVDIVHTEDVLGWRPPFSFGVGIAETVFSFKQT